MHNTFFLHYWNDAAFMLYLSRILTPLYSETVKVLNNRTKHQTHTDAGRKACSHRSNVRLDKESLERAQNDEKIVVVRSLFCLQENKFKS